MENSASSIQETSDGGFTVAGSTRSFGAGGSDVWVLRLDQDGNVVWENAYGGTGDDFAYSVQQVSDGGFIVAGGTRSFGAGNFDDWVLRLDNDGSVVWENAYGGAGDDWANSVQQTFDSDGNPSGFIVAGSTFSFGAGGRDAWVLRLDDDGNVIWENSYGGSRDDTAHQIQQTSDGGFIVAGETSSFGPLSAWVFKLDGDGGVVWDHVYGGADSGSSVQQTSDGGFVVSGSAGGSAWVGRLDAEGNPVWQDTFGATRRAFSVQQTFDGGFVVGGQSLDGAWVAKLDGDGMIGSGCSLIMQVSTTVTDAAAAVTPASSTITDTSSLDTVTPTNAIVTPTSSTPTLQCQDDD